MPPNRPVVFVGDNSPAFQATLKRRLDHVGVHAYLSRSATDTGMAGDYIGGLMCALMTLERPDGRDDPIDEAQLLRLYQPDLPVAFLHEQAGARMLERARLMGPVFRKSDQLEHALDWVVEKVTASKR